MSEPSAPSTLTRTLRIAVPLGVPVLVLLGACWFSAHSAARIWPPVDTPALDSLPSALPSCAGADARLQDLLRIAENVDKHSTSIGLDVELQGALDHLLDCGGLLLVGGPVARRAGTRLELVGERRLARAARRSEAGDLVGGAGDLAAALELSAILEHAGGDLALCSAGVELGALTLDAMERWLDANPDASDEALVPLAAALADQVVLPGGVANAMVWECRDKEAALTNLGAIPAPAILLEPAGVPLWVGWVAEWLPGATVYDVPRTLAMHRHHCALRVDAVNAGGDWDDAELGPVLWDREQLALGPLLDNPLGRITLSRDDLLPRVNAVIQAERTLRSRRALLATRVAVERGSLAHDGLLPLQLELLVPEFLAASPVDPVDGKPINWVRGYGEIFTTREVAGPEGQPQRLVTTVPER